ncbi:MAG: hypothetical protein HONBIEJF_02156 [Fimbriimonadaceae bacterium]|nr:hypothetical protein [Fimbriimonadaceae bacterium]
MKKQLAALLVGLLILAGCAKGDKLVGTWIAERPMQGNTETFILEFSPDKRLDLRNTLIIPNAGSMTIHATGTYSSTNGGETFSPSFKEVTLDAPDLQHEVEDAKNTIVKRYNKEFKPIWKSNDEFDIEIQKSMVRFKRNIE